MTHHHPDHAGGVKGLIEWAPQAEIGLPSTRRRSSPADAPDEPASAFFRPIASRQNVPPAPVAKVLSEGDLVSGFRIISTPGHSLGHVSLLRDADGVLFTADAFGCLPRKIRVGVRKYLCADPPLARRSAGRLLGEDFSTVIFAHGKTPRESEGQATRGRRQVQVLGTLVARNVQRKERSWWTRKERS